MADIFAAHVRDSDETWVQYRVMSQHGSFWYHDAFRETLEEARALAAGQDAPTLIERVTTELIERYSNERATDPTRSGDRPDPSRSDP